MKKIIFCITTVIMAYTSYALENSEGAFVLSDELSSGSAAQALYSMIRSNLAELKEATLEERALMLKGLCIPLVGAQEEFAEKFSSLKGSFEYRLAQKSLQKCEKIAPIILEFLEKMDAELGDLYVEEVLQDNSSEDEARETINSED